MIKATLKKIPLKTGEVIAWIIVGLWIGFAIGWIANAERIAVKCSTQFVI